MSVRVEFFGIPRERSGVAHTMVAPGSLEEVLRELAKRFPRFANDCLIDSGTHWELNRHCIASIEGTRFVNDPECVLRDGDALLILSADAGG